MRVWVPFQRARRRAVVLGERLPYKDARAIARLRSRDRVMIRKFDLALHSIGQPGLGRPPIKPLEARSGRDGVLWVALVPRDPSNKMPSLEEVAQLEAGSPSNWADFITQFDLPERHQDFVVAQVPQRGFELHRIPIKWLREFARKAVLLLAAEHAVLGLGIDRLRRLIEEPEAKSFRAGELIWDLPRLTWPEGDNAEALARLGQEAIARALEQALDQFEPLAAADGHGIPEEWSLYAWGWWPLILLDRFVYRSRRLPPKKCASPGCSNIVPPHRRAYCSERCRQRDKKRRQRHKKPNAHLRERKR